MGLGAARRSRPAHRISCISGIGSLHPPAGNGLAEITTPVSTRIIRAELGETDYLIEPAGLVPDRPEPVVRSKAFRPPEATTKTRRDDQLRLNIYARRDRGQRRLDLTRRSADSLDRSRLDGRVRLRKLCRYKRLNLGHDTRNSDIRHD
jgi:hypothetical protein